LGAIGRARSPGISKKANPDTATTYRIRAKTLLEDYLSYQANPLTSAPPSAPSPPGSGNGSDDGFQTYRLGNGRVFRFQAPETLSQKDVRKIAYHLLTLADDWEPPTNPPEPPTKTPEPPTNTPEPPTNTPEPPTNTPPP
jgi:hypothetical protein